MKYKCSSLFWLLLLISINIWFINCKTVEINSANKALFLRTQKSRLLSCVYLITHCKTAEIITANEGQYISFKIWTNWTNAPHDICYHTARDHAADRTISRNSGFQTISQNVVTTQSKPLETMHEPTYLYYKRGTSLNQFWDPDDGKWVLPRLFLDSGMAKR
jgi:hypothetical protein